MEDAVRHRLGARRRARGHSRRAGARRGRARAATGSSPRPPSASSWAQPWPHPGLARRAGAPLFRLDPGLDPDLSLAALDGEVASAEAELALAATEAQRARELAKGGVVSAAELDRAEATLASRGGACGIGAPRPRHLPPGALGRRCSDGGRS